MDLLNGVVDIEDVYICKVGDTGIKAGAKSTIGISNVCVEESDIGGNGIPDFCDPCAVGDSDGHGVCDDAHICLGNEIPIKSCLISIRINGLMI